MNIRPVKLPQDLDVMNTLILEGFDYPDHPEWSIQPDEKEGMLDRLKGMKRMWPILQILRFFSPILRDTMRGFIAEEDGKPIGLMNHMRDNKEPEWFLANAAVLPAYRRRGIARQMLAAIQKDVQQNRGGGVLILGAIDQNVPSLDSAKAWASRFTPARSKWTSRRTRPSHADSSPTAQLSRHARDSTGAHNSNWQNASRPKM